MELLSEPKIVFNDYKKTALYIPTPNCNFKCVKEAKAKGIDFVECQNHKLINQRYLLNLSTEEILDNYIKTNPFIECIILSGLDPLDSFKETIKFIKEFREKEPEMEIVIFTGYYEKEILNKMEEIKKYKNITMKFGRYDPTEKSRYDEVGEVTLISGNQYFKKVS